MSREFPDFVDPWKAADGRRTFQGTMPIRRMKRLEPLLAPEGDEAESETLVRGEADFIARFSYDRQGLVIIRLGVNAELPLVCQRSLEPYREPVSRRSVLAVIEDVSDQEEIPDAYEPVLVEHRRLALLDIVEEELLLAVPQVPRNPASARVERSTDGQAAGAEEPRHKPFAGLAGLMTTKLKD
jgi:uncharacterized protein